MAVDFNFDTNFNDDDENKPAEEMEPDEEQADDDEAKAKRPNRIRLILLALLIVVLLCVVCFIAAARFSPVAIPGLTAGSQPAAPATQDTPTPTGDQTAAGAQGAGEAVAGADQAATQTAEAQAVPPAADEGETTDQAAAEGEQPAAEPTATPTEASVGEVAPSETPTVAIATPVPGPTPTPAGEQPATDVCAANTLPVAEAGGPYEAMLEAGEAIVIFDASGSSDADGTIDSYGWDFGDGGQGDGPNTQHGYTAEGSFMATLTISDNCGSIVQDSAEVNITTVSPTPPAEDGQDDSSQPEPAPGSDDQDDSQEEEEAPEAPAYNPPPVAPWLGTLGFCYQVQPGDTLSGIAEAFGRDWVDLAYVNGVSPHYYVMAGQGLFIPTGQILPSGPNIYQVYPGDTLDSIAYQCGIPMPLLAGVNGLPPYANLSPGQVIIIPPPWSY